MRVTSTKVWFVTLWAFVQVFLMPSVANMEVYTTVILYGLNSHKGICTGMEEVS